MPGRPTLGPTATDVVANETFETIAYLPEKWGVNPVAVVTDNAASFQAIHVLIVFSPNISQYLIIIIHCYLFTPTICRQKHICLSVSVKVRRCFEML